MITLVQASAFFELWKRDRELGSQNGENPSISKIGHVGCYATRYQNAKKWIKRKQRKYDTRRNTQTLS